MILRCLFYFSEKCHFDKDCIESVNCFGYNGIFYNIKYELYCANIYNYIVNKIKYINIIYNSFMQFVDFIFIGMYVWHMQCIWRYT